MQAQAWQAPRTATEGAAWLKAYLEAKDLEKLQVPDLFLIEWLRRLSALDLVNLCDAMAFPPGSPRTILVYKSWLESTSAASAGAYAVWYNLGVQCGSIQDTQSQITCYRNALALKPDLYQAAVNLGLVYENLGQLDVALAIWRDHLQPREARIALLNHCGRICEAKKVLDEAEDHYRESLLLNPQQSDVLHHFIGLRTRMCRWPVYDPTLPGVTRTAMEAATRALTLLAMADDIDRQTEGNASWIAEKMPPAPLSMTDGKGYGHAKLRIGYLSSDFCRHPMAYLVSELFERHDRQRFEIYGYCSTKDDNSDERRRIHRAFDTCVDARAMSDEELAHRIRRDEIDILIDLNGLTLGSRLQALRWRPAPVQLTYLGYNGPIPLPELDYIIADEYVIPPEVAVAHQPAPLYMPTCYQVNDTKLAITPPPPRSAVGLPDDRFVFCIFSNTYKVTEPVFDSWMEILNRVPRSVLWIFVDNDYAKSNLSQRAEAAGVAPERLIYATRVEPSQYRGRLALADLFLDTYPYNAGTTASDALRVGLPLITVAGRSFTARMAGSLLTAMGLPDLVLADHRAYIELAVELATDPDRYRGVKSRVTPQRWAETIGDCAGFCRHLEAALERVAIR
jgi:predicted O-linked N-acetylglucosamine transferase (SPINDLY family)